MATRQRVNAFNLADQYLTALGWPNTPVTRRVMAAWFMRESARVSGSNTDIYVVGNNPLNISCRSCGNARIVGHMRIVEYPNTESGIAAFKSLIGNSGPGYSGIVGAFNSSQDATTLIHSINKSGWVTGNTNSYIHGKTNGLASTYNSIGAGDISTTGGGTTATPSAPFINIAEGKTLTAADIEYMVQRFKDAGIISHDNNMPDTVLVRGILMNYVGHPWNKDTQNQMQQSLQLGANLSAEQLGPVGMAQATAAIPSTIINVFGGLAGKAVGIAAILMGSALVAFGAFVVIKDTYSGEGNGNGMLDITPIILRE